MSVIDNTKPTNTPTPIIYAASLDFGSCSISNGLEGSQLKPQSIEQQQSQRSVVFHHSHRWPEWGQELEISWLACSRRAGKGSPSLAYSCNFNHKSCSIWHFSFSSTSGLTTGRTSLLSEKLQSCKLHPRVKAKPWQWEHFSASPEPETMALVRRL